MNNLLCVAFYPYDAVHLATVAALAKARFGLQPVFLSLAPPQPAAEVRALAVARGFSSSDRPLLAPEDPTIKNPFRRCAAARAENLRLVDDVVAELRPAAVVSCVNGPPGLFLDAFAARGIPTVLLQLVAWGDRAFYRELQAADRRHEEQGFTLPRKIRRTVLRGVRRLYGIGPHVTWEVKQATVAVQGPGQRDRLTAEGMPRSNVVATGNPVLDELFHARQDVEAIGARLRSSLGIQAGKPIITYLRSFEDRLLTLARDVRERSQVEVIRAFRAAAPDAAVVVKTHPREGDADRTFVQAIDPAITVVGNEVSTTDLLAAAAVNVSTVSFTLLHSVALDRPAVSAYLWDGLDYLGRATDWSAVERVRTGADLTTAVERHLHDAAHQAKWRDRREEFIQNEFLFDGHGADRVVATIGAMSESR